MDSHRNSSEAAKGQRDAIPDRQMPNSLPESSHGRYSGVLARLSSLNRNNYKSCSENYNEHTSSKLHPCPPTSTYRLSIPSPQPPSMPSSTPSSFRTLNSLTGDRPSPALHSLSSSQRQSSNALLSLSSHDAKAGALGSPASDIVHQTSHARRSTCCAQPSSIAFSKYVQVVSMHE